MPNFTERAIKQAFAELINEKPLSKIKVKDIVERCGINRNSFYYHYADLPALVDSIITGKIERVTENFSTFTSMNDAFVAVIDVILKNKTAIFHIYNSVDHTVSERYLLSMCDKVINAGFDQIYGDRGVSPQDRKIVTRHYKEMFFGMLYNWVESGMKYDIVAYFNRLCELKEGETDRIIEKCVKNF